MRLLSIIRESSDDEEQKAIAHIRRLAADNDDDLYDAIREFRSIYGYTPTYSTPTPRRVHTSHARAPRNRFLGMYFYNVLPGQEQDAKLLGLTQTQGGKWGLKIFSGAPYDVTRAAADSKFGEGKWWEPKR